MDFSKITDFLYIGTTPRTEDYSILRDLGVHLVINMRVERRPYRDLHHPPMPVLWLPTMDSPLVPIPIRMLRRGVLAALDIIHKGGVVYGHCQAGRHRGVALGSAILIALGYTPEEAMQQILEQRKVADPYIWYIRRRIEHFGAVWGTHQASLLNPSES